jgi:trimeric autotransporter adhesin
MKWLAPFAVVVSTVTGFVALGLYVHSVARGNQKTAGPQFAAAAGSPVAVGPMAQKILVADLNGDGNPDIVLTCGGTTQGKPDPKKGFVAVLAGDGRGAFKAAQPLIPIGADGLKAAVGDVNGDKRPDIVVIAHDSYSVTILLQDERGRFDADQKWAVQASKGDHPHTHDVAVADANGDGNLDILTTNEDDGNVSVLLGDGTGRFGPAKGSPFAAGRHPYEGLSVGDLNGDNKPDVVVPNILGKAVSVLLGDGAGAFAAAPGSPVAVGDRPGFVALGDLTGDSKLDVVATHDDDPTVYVLRGDGRGGLRPTAGSPVKLKENVWGAVVADVNADGKTDLVLGAKKGHVLILSGDGAGGFDKDPVLVPVGGKAPGNIAVADVNRDGKLDLVTSNYESGDVSVLIQR